MKSGVDKKKPLPLSKKLNQPISFVFYAGFNGGEGLFMTYNKDLMHVLKIPLRALPSEMCIFAHK